MASSTHFEHHRRELVTNRRRFNGIVTLLFVALVVVSGIAIKFFSQASSPCTNAGTNIFTSSNNQNFAPGTFCLLDAGYEAIFQGDGNFVLYGANGAPLWNSGTSNRGATALVAQSDGNFVIYAGGTWLWDTATNGRIGAWMALQGDGNLVVYTSSNTPVWSSKTAGSAAAAGNIQGYKVTPNGGTGGAFAGATVTVDGLGSSTGNPFFFSGNVPPGVHTVSASGAGGYTQTGWAWCDEQGSGSSACSSGWVNQSSSGNAFNVNVLTGHIIEVRFFYTPIPTPTPVPATPAPTPVTRTPTPVPVAKTPAPGSVATPKPTTNPVPGSSAKQTKPTTGSGSAGTTAAADTTPPPAPSGFTAAVSASGGDINLSWMAASDASGIAAYHIDSSIDHTAWKPISASISGTSVDDTSVGYGTHYYYRLTATDGAGNTSAYAFADATTGAFVANTTGVDTQVASTDKLVTANIPSGAVSGDANCSIVAGDSRPAVSKGQSVIAGPYSLLCKDSSGNQITTVTKPIAWQYSLAQGLKGHTAPVAVLIDTNGSTTKTTATLNKKAQILTFSDATTMDTAVLASVKKGLPLNLISGFIIFILLIGGILMLLLRRGQKQSYSDYIRSKYYDI